VRKEGGPANFKNRVKAQTAQVGFSYYLNTFTSIYPMIQI
jgi:hypothetical protein